MNALVEGMILYFSTWTRVLFDPRVSHSYISTSFALLLNLEFLPLYCSSSVESPIGGNVETKEVCYAFVFYIGIHEVTMDLVFLVMSTFDVIVGMD